MKHLARTIRQACDERGVRFGDAVAACERALVAAAEDVYGDARAFEASYDAVADELCLRVYMTVVAVVENPNTQVALRALEAADTHAELGEDVGFEVFYLPAHRERARAQDAQFGEALGFELHRERFGRIAIHQAKQALIHALRDAERAAVCDLYGPLVGQLVAGIADKVGRHDHVTVSLGGGITGLLPREHQHPRDRLSAGEWVVCEVLAVEREDGPPLTLTRTGVGMVRELLGFEVPDVADGRVIIETIAREAGGRCKVAVSTRRDDVDPVGACIGEGGSHMRAMTEALLGERVDVIDWHDDPEMLACHALGCGVVHIDDVDGVLRLHVPDGEMALAVGRGGENLRLARRLAGVDFQAVAARGRCDDCEHAMGDSVQGTLCELAGYRAVDSDYMQPCGDRTPEEICAEPKRIPWTPEWCPLRKVTT